MSAAPTSTWDEDPDGASVLVATGRARHDLLVVAEPALLTELDAAWGRPDARVRLSFLPGVSAPTAPGHDDALTSHERDGRAVLVARGRTAAYEGRPTRRTTALARIAAGTGVRAALLVTRATGLGATAPGDLLAVSDHLNLSGAPLFPASAPVDATWDTGLVRQLADLDGVRGTGVVALTPGPVRPTPAEAALLGGLGADAVVMDTVAEAMALASRGVRVCALAYVDHAAGAEPRRRAGRRAASPADATDPTGRAPSATAQRHPAPQVVRVAVETLLAGLG